MRTAYKCRAYPTPEQAAILNRTFGCIRVVWNRTLAWRRHRYSTERATTNFTQANAYLTAMKRSVELVWLNEVSAVPLQQTIRHQQAAYMNFFAGRARHPRYKSRTGRQSAEYTRSGFRYRDGVAASRADFLHKTSARLVRDHDVIVIEDLSVENMIRNRRLAKAIADCGWGQFRRHLEYKTARYGRQLIVIDRWFPSSKMCSECGYLLAALALSARTWQCSSCGTRHDRDVNAAKNILAAGRAVSARGADVRPQGSSLRQSAAKRETSPARVGLPSV